MNNQNNSFEEMDPVQYRDLYQEEDTPLDSMRSDTFRRLIYIGTILVAGFIVSGFVLKISHYEHTDFVLRSEIPETTYQYYDDLYLERYFVTTGDTVEKGTPLAAIRSEQISTLISDLRAIETNLKNLKENRKAALESEFRTFQLENEELGLQLDNLHTNREITDSLYRLRFKELQSDNILAKNELGRSRDLFEKELISEREFEDVRQKAFLASNRLEQLKTAYQKEITGIEGDINQLEKQKAVNRSKIEAMKKRFKAELELRESQRRDILSELYQNYGNAQVKEGSLVLTAEQQGMVSYHFETDRLVPAGSVLLKMVAPGKRSFYGYTTIGSELAGRVYSDLPAIIKIDAYPHYDWGTIDGIVYLVSQTDNERGEYGLKVKLFNEEEFRGILKNGMTGIVSIPIESKSLFGYLFDKVETTYSDVYE